MKIFVLFFLSVAICACSSNSVEDMSQPPSGFIGDYSKFEKVETSDGLKSFKYVSDEIKSGIYHKVIIDPVAFYPREETSDQVTSELLSQTKAYFDENFVAAITQSIEVVDSPQPGALRVTPRITAIQTTTGDVSLKEVVPIGAVIALGKAATGHRRQNVEVFVEIKATDSLSGEFIGGTIKQGKGHVISGAYDVVELSDITPVLDAWVKDAKESFGKLDTLTAEK